jgi:hypothetical protein
MRRLLVAVLGCALAGALAPPAHAIGSFHLGCSVVGFAQIDPIFSWSRTSAHLHVFRGNRTINWRSTYETLRAATAEQSSCTRLSDAGRPGHGDLSAYWAPTLVRREADGSETRIPLGNNAIYYRAKHHQPAAIQPFPPGIKLRSGDPHASTPAPWGRGSTMTCTHEGILIRRVGGSFECRDVNLLDGHTPTLTMFSFFPSCWNGKAPTPSGTSRLATDDTPKTSYAVSLHGTGGGPWTCPASYPIPIPELIVIWSWNTSGGPDVVLTGDNEFGEHADFFEAWEPAVMQKLVANCLRRAIDCGAGDGT